LYLPPTLPRGPAYETQSDPSSRFPDPGRAHLGHRLRRAGRLRRYDRHVHVQRRPLFHRRARAAGAHRGAECHAQGPPAAHGGGKTRRAQTALAIASNFQQAGITAGTDAGKAGFLTALYVVLVPVFGLFFRRRVSLPVWIAVALSVVSLYLLCIKGSFRLAAGDLLVLVCAVCFAVHILVIDHFGATCDGVKLSCVQFLFAGLWSAVCIPFFEHVDAAALLSCALPLLYVGVFSCGVGYTLQILAQKDSNPTVVTILLSLESVFAVIAGAIILHQHMTPREYLGCALMFLAVVLAQIPLPAKAARAGK
jgi:drug/metabolite transporter (DMT)-like permease